MKEANGFGLSAPIKLLRTELERSGYKNAIDLVKKQKNIEPGLKENDVNGWGYKLFKQNRITDALEIFKLNAFLYPDSGNVFDSLGEIYAELGNTALAIKNYERSLVLDPGNSNAAEQLKRLKGK